MVKIESTDNSSWIFFKTEKNRDGEAINFNAVAYWTENQFYLSETETRVKEKPLSKSQNYVMSYLKNNGASSLPDIMGSADICSERSAKQAVYALVELGKVYRTNPEQKGQGSIAVYDLTKDSNEPS